MHFHQVQLRSFAWHMCKLHGSGPVLRAWERLIRKHTSRGEGLSEGKQCPDAALKKPVARRGIGNQLLHIFLHDTWSRNVPVLARRLERDVDEKAQSGGARQLDRLVCKGAQGIIAHIMHAWDMADCGRRCRLSQTSRKRSIGRFSDVDGKIDILE